MVMTDLFFVKSLLSWIDYDWNGVDLYGVDV